MAELAIGLSGLHTRAPSGEVILCGVDWTVERGAIGVIVGSSGSGKSRLLRVLNRLDERAEGEVEVQGRSIDDWAVAELRRAVAWVPQRPTISMGSGRANLELVTRLGLVDSTELAGRLPAALAATQLDAALLDRDASVMSGGERHRVALARALLLEPAVLLLDEPSGALDGASAAAVLRSLVAWAAERGSTLIVVTHRVEDAHTLGGTMLVLDRGRVARRGPSHELLADPADYDVHHLLTGRGEGSS